MNVIKNSILPVLTAVALAIGIFALLRGLDSSKTAASDSASSGSTEAVLRHGEYLVKLGGCTDCHTPKVMTAQGPADDPERLFAGHPSDVLLAAPEADPDNPWGASTAGMTAWTGPWGVTFAANLTPDPESGIGSWSEEDFVQTFRTGKHKGTGRAILPPMPWQPLSEATEEDLSAIYAFLMSLPPVRNVVPQPLPPATAAK